MSKKIQKPRSVRAKLFLSLCIVIVLTIIFLIIINNIVLETFYIYNKKDIEKHLYEQVNEKFNSGESLEEITEFIKEQSTKNNLDIYILNEKNGDFVVSNQLKIKNIENLKNSVNYNEKGKIGEVLYSTQNITIKMVKDAQSDRIHIVMLATLDNGGEILVVTPISAIKDSLRVSNQVLIFVGII